MVDLTFWYGQMVDLKTPYKLKQRPTYRRNILCTGELRLKVKDVVLELGLPLLQENNLVLEFTDCLVQQGPDGDKILEKDKFWHGRMVEHSIANKKVVSLDLGLKSAGFP